MRSFLIFLLAVALFSAAPVHARGPFGHGKHGHGGARFIEHHAEQLGLDDATREAIQAVVAGSAEENSAAREELREAQGAMRALLQEPLPDTTAVMNQADLINEIRGDMHKARLATVLEIRALLSEEQREMLVALMEERRAEFAERRAEFQARIEEACAQDIAELCPNEEAGRARGMCLRKNRDQLSEDCRSAFAERRSPRRPDTGPN